MAKIEIQAKENTWLKRSTEQASILPDTQKKFIEKGKIYPLKKYKEDQYGHLWIDIDYDAGEWYIFADHWQFLNQKSPEKYQENFPFSKKILKEIMPHASLRDINTYAKPINQVCQRFSITTFLRTTMFIAQVAHESGSLRYKEEIASGAAYEGRRDLGNTQPGDGRRYKGRGLIQLTGRHNYTIAGKQLGIDLVGNPQLAVKDPFINALIAGWYWNSRSLNTWADRNDFRRVTRLINGGYNGWNDRLSYWARAKSALKI